MIALYGSVTPNVTKVTLLLEEAAAFQPPT